MKRHYITITYEVVGKEDHEAIQEGHDLAAKMRHEEDNNAQLAEVHSRVVGSVEPSKKVF